MVLSSCSKDTTEITAPQSGNLEVFSASIAVEESNSTRLGLVEGTDENGKTTVDYRWNAGDGVGVGAATAIDANIPTYNTVDGATNAKFAVTENDARYFGDWSEAGLSLFAYFPYSPEGVLEKVGDDVVANLEIKSTQRYEENSFYKNTVPAVGYVENYVIGESEIKMQVPVSMIRLNVRGWGETNALTLKIQKPASAEFYTLAGEQQVVIPTDGETLPAFKEPTIGSQEITLTFGNKSEDFDYDVARVVYFVVPAGLQLADATLILSNGTDDEELTLDFIGNNYKTQPNKVFSLKSENYHFNFGMDGKFVIEDDAVATSDFNDGYTAEEKFIAYAYMAQTQESGDAATILDHMTNLNAAGFKFGLRDIAWIKEAELNFAEEGNEYNEAWAKANFDKAVLYLSGSAAESDTDKQNIAKFWKDVYAWYAANGGAIQSLGYNSIVGDGIAAAQVTINGLKVKGTGITAGASLKNLKFENTAVIADAEAGFIGDKNDLISVVSGSLTVNTSIENVTIGTGCSVTGTTQVVAGVYATYTKGKGNDVEVEAAPVVTSNGGKSAMYARFNSAGQGHTFDLSESVYTWNAEMPLIGSLTGSRAIVNFVIPEDKLVADAYCGVINGAGVNISVFVGETGYWNGQTLAPNTDGILTAEEFAYELSQVFAVSKTITLTHNIDFQSTESLANYNAATRKYIVDGTNHTLSNIVLAQTTNGHNGLFGYEADVKNLTIDGLTITNGNSNFGFSGLATIGKADNVTVKNVNLTLGSYTGNVGAIFATTDAANLKNVTVDGFTVVGTPAASAGAVVGELVVSADTNIEGINVVKMPNGYLRSDDALTTAKVSDIASYKGSNYYYNYKSYDAKCPFGVIAVNAAEFTPGQNANSLTVTGEYGSRLAAGYTFPKSFLDDVAKIESAEPGVLTYDYKFTTNVTEKAKFMNCLVFTSK